MSGVEPTVSGFNTYPVGENLGHAAPPPMPPPMPARADNVEDPPHPAVIVQQQFQKRQDKLEVAGVPLGVALDLFQNQLWRLNNLYKIRDKSGKVVTFCLNPEQEDLYKGMTYRNVILKARQLGFCLDPRTRVLTSDLRWIRIEHLVEGDRVIAVDEHVPGGRGSARKMRTATVQRVGEVYGQAYRIHFDDGRSVVCTGPHPWLTRKAGTDAKWRAIEPDSRSSGKLKVGTKVRWITKPWGEGSFEDGWFGGMLDGEGSISLPSRPGVSVSVSQVEGDVMDRMRAYLSDSGYSYREEEDEGLRPSKFGSRSVNKLVCSRSDEVFRLIGQTRPSRFMGYEWWEGKELPGKRTSVGWATVVEIEPLGARRMIDLQTSTGTYIAEGFVSHNTTFMSIFGLDQCLFNPNYYAGIIAHNLDDAAKIFDQKIKFAYERLAPEIRSHVTAKNDRTGTLNFSNGSSITVSTSYRSGTLSLLHVSELGKIAATRPDKALEIKTGAYEAVPIDGIITLESTAEGREGEFYDTVQTAKKLRDAGRTLTKQDFKLFFYPWWKNVEYQLDPEHVVFTEEDKRYFEELEAKGIKTTERQQAWWIKKRDVLGEEMFREYPSYEDEAFLASIQGAYYAKVLDNLRRQGRIGRVPYDGMFPVYTSWDLGLDDSMTIWFFQAIHRRIHIIDYHESSGEGWDFYARLLHDKGYSYHTHYMPHDAGRREQGEQVRKREDIARSLGIRPITVTDRPRNTEALLKQIDNTRLFLEKAWIDEAKCSEGLKALENYRKEWDEKLGAFKRTPLHNWASHGADGIRTAGAVFKFVEDVMQTELMPPSVSDY